MTLTEALRALHEAGRIRSPWLPGMQLTVHTSSVTVDRYRFLERISKHAKVDHVWVDDPATRGCLLALLREASGDQSLSPLRNGSRAAGLGGARAWRILTSDGVEHPQGEWPTEGEAIAAAIVALAEARP